MPLPRYACVHGVGGWMSAQVSPDYSVSGIGDQKRGNCPWVGMHFGGCGQGPPVPQNKGCGSHRPRVQCHAEKDTPCRERATVCSKLWRVRTQSYQARVREPFAGEQMWEGTRLGGRCQYAPFYINLLCSQVSVLSGPNKQISNV